MSINQDLTNNEPFLKYDIIDSVREITCFKFSLKNDAIMIRQSLRYDSAKTRSPMIYDTLALPCLVHSWKINVVVVVLGLLSIPYGQKS